MSFQETQNLETFLKVQHHFFCPNIYNRLLKIGIYMRCFAHIKSFIMIFTCGKYSSYLVIKKKLAAKISYGILDFDPALKKQGTSSHWAILISISLTLDQTITHDCAQKTHLEEPWYNSFWVHYKQQTPQF